MNVVVSQRLVHVLIHTQLTLINHTVRLAKDVSAEVTERQSVSLEISTHCLVPYVFLASMLLFTQKVLKLLPGHKRLEPTLDNFPILDGRHKLRAVLSKKSSELAFAQQGLRQLEKLRLAQPLF